MGVSLNPNAFFDRAITPNLVLPVTVAGWVRVDTDLNDFTTICWLGDDTTTDHAVLIALNSDGVTPIVYDSDFTGDITGTAMTVGGWYYLAVTAAAGAGGYKLYQAAENTPLALTDSATYSGTFDGEKIGLGGGRPDGESNAVNADASFSCWRVWTAELSLAELALEMRSAAAVRTSHLLDDHRFKDITDCRLDQSGLGNHLTYTAGTGSIATTGDPGFTRGASGTAGLGQILTGSGVDRVTRSNLTDLSGSLWEAVTDWYFGYSFVDYDWNDTAQSTLFEKWTFSADQNMVAQVNVLPDDHHVEIVGATGDADGLSNLRELHTIPETATWGVAHAQCEIYGGPKFLTGGTLDEGRLVIKPQHGIGLRAQEDTRRRTIIAWHDIAIGLPQAINLGVWSGNPDGTGFLNRQINLGMDLDESYIPTACAVVNDDDAGLSLDGSGCFQTPETTDLDISGDWSAKIDFSPIDWTPVVHFSLFSKFVTTGNQRAYRARLTSGGAIEVVTSNDGTNTSGPQKTFTMDAAGVAILSAKAANERYTIAIDFDADNGASGATCTFWGAPTWNGPFTQLGAAITVAGVATIFNSNAAFELGGVNIGTTERLVGRMHQFQLRAARLDLDGNQAEPPRVDVRPFQYTDGATSFTDNVGRAFTKTGTTNLVANTQRGEAVVTIGAHSLRVGDRVNVIVGEELSVTALQRTGGSACQCTLPGGHGIVTGSNARILFASDSSFDGTFVVNVSGNTATWTDAGSNISGHTALLWDNTYDSQTAEILEVDATTITVRLERPTRAVVTVTSGSRVIREFPYYMELKVEGTVASVRCWGRHQTIPDWMDQSRALICDLTKAARSFNVTLRERSANVATLTIGTHDLIIGDRINIAAVESSFNSTSRIVTALSATTVSYANTGADVTSTASSGTCAAVGSGAAADIIANPCPTGSGRVAFINAHLGVNDLCRCVYGPFFGDNDPASQILAMSLEAATTPLDLAFGFPQVVAGQAGTAVTPAVLASSFSLPAAAESVGAGPSVLARTFTFPAAAGSVGAAPTVIPLAAGLPQATPVTAGNATALPAVLAGVFAFPQAATSTGVTVSPAVLARALAFGQAAESVGAGPVVIARAFVLPQAVPQTAGNATATPLVIDRAFVLPAVTVTAAGVASPAVLARSLVFPQAVGSSPALAAPAVLARSFELPAAAVVVAAQATPAAIAVLAALATPGVSVGVTPASLALVFLFGTPAAGSYPPDPHPTHLTFGGQDGGVTFAARSGLIIFRRRQ